MCRIQDSAHNCVQRQVTLKRQRLTARAWLSKVLVEHSSRARWANKTRFFSFYSQFPSSQEVLYLLLQESFISASEESCPIACERA
jgi:hypothetical protein